MDIRALHHAAKVVEADGLEGFRSAAEMVGVEAALSLLVAHLRRDGGSMGAWPADPDIEPKVNGILSETLPEIYAIFSQRPVYISASKWSCLDSNAAFAVMYRGKIYPTATHALQAAKFTVPIFADGVRGASSPYDAEKTANRPDLKRYLREDWDTVELLFMEEILRAKWEQYAYVRQTLSESKGMLICGPGWSGENHQGNIWMKIRDEK